ncbi:MAG TPA: chloride channel protein [Anaeromyxobacteraceae bacterium]|nr:chloride channel protein [Anaeromyxobacteraceae bacterium]
MAEHRDESTPDAEAPGGRAAAPGLRPVDALRVLAGLTDRAPLELRLLGRTLLHATAVGIIAGLAGAAFFAGLELCQRVLLEGLAGFEPLRARGEALGPETGAASFSPFLLALLPALGGLASGVLTAWLAPEAAGGGGNATIEAYHRGGVFRRRVAPVKAIASILALSSGGSGGREGPTMQIGAGIGAAVGRWLPTSRSERRVLVVAGIAGGIAAVFRTPLGAALLATEMLYRDDFEADALVPSIFSSVVSYSIVIALFGETTLFGTLPRFPFTPAHLPLYAALALAVAVVAIVFARTLGAVQRGFSRLAVPVWTRPALGGLLMGGVGTALALWMQAAHGPESTGFGVFGGGYGVLQVAMTGAPWLETGWTAAILLAGVALAKLVASALTIGSGAAAGDFAPSLVIGGLVGAAFGVAAQQLLGDPSIRPAAFALVGMGTFYGGLAHAPLSALVLVAELAGSYDLLVPMMLAIGIAQVALRKDTLYPAQLPSRLGSAVHRDRSGDAAVLELATRRSVAELLVAPELPVYDDQTPLDAVVAAAAGARWQRVAAVRGPRGFAGLLELTTVAELPAEDRRWLRARDALVPFVAVPEDAGWAEVAELLERRGLAQVPVVRDGVVVGWVGDRELRRAVLDAGRDEAERASE